MQLRKQNKQKQATKYVFPFFKFNNNNFSSYIYVFLWKIFTLTRTTQRYVHVILQARLRLCRLFAGSERFEKVRHSDSISSNDLFTPLFSFLCFPSFTLAITPSPSIPSWHCRHRVAPKSYSGQGWWGWGGRVTATSSQFLGSHVLTISSILCEIMQIF